MLRKFSKDFVDRLDVATLRYANAIKEFNMASDSFPEEIRAMEDQFRQIMGHCIKISRTLESHIEDGKMEEFERYIEYRKELQAINELEQDIIAEELSKFNRNAESYQRLLESVKRMERRQRTLLKRRAILAKIELSMKVIKALTTITDEVSVQRTENASDETDEGSTTIEVAERKLSSEVDDEGSTAGTMEKVEEFLKDGKLTTSEKQSSVPGQSSEEQLDEVKQSSSEIDQSSIADRNEARQELSAVAGRSNNEGIELQKSTAVVADATLKLVEGLAKLEKNLVIFRLMKKFLGLSEEASYADGKFKERLDNIYLHFHELDALFDELETVKKEFLEL